MLGEAEGAGDAERFGAGDRGQMTRLAWFFRRIQAIQITVRLHPNRGK